MVHSITTVNPAVWNRRKNLKYWFWQHLYDFPLQQSYWSGNMDAILQKRIILKIRPSWEREHEDTGLFISCLLLLDFSKFTKHNKTWLDLLRWKKIRMSYLVCQISHWEKWKLKQLVGKIWCSVNISSKLKKESGRAEKKLIILRTADMPCLKISTRNLYAVRVIAYH